MRHTLSPGLALTLLAAAWVYAEEPVPPAGVIERVTVDGQSHESPTQTITAPPGEGALEFHYGVPPGAAAETVHYRYRLCGRDSDWIEAGSQRVATYTGLRPGHYSFEVVTCLVDGVCREDATHVSVRLTPHWYQTSWWYLLLAVVVAAAVVAVVAALVWWVVRLVRRRADPAALQWATDDQRHLGMLSIGHYVVAALGALWGCFPLIYVVMGVVFLVAPFESKGGEQPPAIVGALMVAGGLTFALLLWGLAGCIAAAGRFLAQRRRYLYCFVMAVVQVVLCNPFGTVLGVFTIIVLIRPSVKGLFESAPAQAGPPAGAG
jgi:hypothetical protein